MTSYQEVVDKVEPEVVTLAPTAWIIGCGWNERRLRTSELPGVPASEILYSQVIYIVVGGGIVRQNQR